MQTVHVSYRLREEDKRMIEMLAQHYGMSETDVVKMAIRELATRKIGELNALNQLRKENEGVA